jgi:hypothetical protein
MPLTGPVALLILTTGTLVLLPPSLPADGLERLKVGRQPDGRIPAPMNQLEL